MNRSIWCALFLSLGSTLLASGDETSAWESLEDEAAKLKTKLKAKA